MSLRFTWLPDLLLSTEHEDYSDYQEEVYRVFKHDFYQNRVFFNDKKIVTGGKIVKGKEGSFWHVVSYRQQKEDSEEDRIISIPRCERIGWIKAVIANAYREEVLVWVEQRQKGQKRHYLFLENKGFLVILAERKAYFKLVTAYIIIKAHQKKAMRKRFKNAGR